MRKLFVLTLTLMLAASCAQQPAQQPAAPPLSSRAIRRSRRHTTLTCVEFLRRNPTVNTYLGGAGLDPTLREVDGMLRDHSAAALAEEDRWLGDAQKTFENFAPDTLAPARRIDREVALAQISFLLHQHQARRYQERALDTYVNEPFRAVDFSIQGMTQTGPRPTARPTSGRSSSGACKTSRATCKPRRSNSPQVSAPATRPTIA